MYNATWLWAPQRFATRLRVLRRAATQLNDLFVTFRSFALRLSTRLVSARRDAPLRNSTICLFLFASRHGATLRGSVRRSAALRNSTLRFVYFFSRLTPQLNDLFVNLSSLRAAALLDFPQRYALLLNDLFVTSRRSAPLHPAGLRNTPPRNATICLLRRNDDTPCRNSTLLDLPHCCAPPFNATN